ncbi:hypothetical protein IC235_14470 [Hymenobacter sp. BT664]|uniref:Protein kinase domain-containing protein n=1 Tax=Hymenobacter montanus TaxID=2771359 RepID=A0A927BF38_9BACT|nr:hypothetical protein [Hymenobacter montanus]MBD2769095.1 hypothetical protein [Hymenobacter montanus]
MDAQALLSKILASRSPDDVFTRLNYRKEYLAYLKLLHPDVCQLPHATDAVARLNQYVEQLEALLRLTDDAGLLRVLPGNQLRFEGEHTLLHQSRANYQRLMALRDPAAQHFHQYLPAALTWDGPALLATTAARVVPLAGLVLPAQHVAWILSRMLEFVAWLHQAGFCHAGFNPESLALVPETHGLVCLSFYHMTSLNGPLSTISGKYRLWYPDATFAAKRGAPGIDLALAQRTAVCLLGDASGNGVRLRATVDERLVNFLLKPQQNAFVAFTEYRKLLRQLYPKREFHPLNI